MNFSPTFVAADSVSAKIVLLLDAVGMRGDAARGAARVRREAGRAKEALDRCSIRN